MNLRTDVLLRHDGKYVLCIGKGETCGPDEVNGDPTVQHDAMAAHALLQTLHEQWGTNPVTRIEKRADELMREWGYIND